MDDAWSALGRGSAGRGIDQSEIPVHHRINGETAFRASVWREAQVPVCPIKADRAFNSLDSSSRITFRDQSAKLNRIIGEARQRGRLITIGALIIGEECLAGVLVRRGEDAAS